MQTVTKETKTVNDLRAERKALTNRLANCDSGAFPGSREWRAERAAMDALAAFDAAHPEVLVAINAERSVKVLGSKDLLGL